MKEDGPYCVKIDPVVKASPRYRVFLSGQFPFLHIRQRLRHEQDHRLSFFLDRHLSGGPHWHFLGQLFQGAPDLEQVSFLVGNGEPEGISRLEPEKVGPMC